jgi:hypothetical protein
MDKMTMEGLAQRIRAGKAAVEAMPEPFELIYSGFLTAVVCTTLKDVDEVARRLEMVYPAETSMGWQLMPNSENCDNPVQCEAFSDRKHWVFEP